MIVYCAGRSAVPVLYLTCRALGFLRSRRRLPSPAAAVYLIGAFRRSALYFVGCAGRLVQTCGDVANWLVLYTATIAKQ